MPFWRLGILGYGIAYTAFMTDKMGTEVFSRKEALTARRYDIAQREADLAASCIPLRIVRNCMTQRKQIHEWTDSDSGPVCKSRIERRNGNSMFIVRK